MTKRLRLAGSVAGPIGTLVAVALVAVSCGNDATDGTAPLTASITRNDGVQAPRCSIFIPSTHTIEFRTVGLLPYPSGAHWTWWAYNGGGATQYSAGFTPGTDGNYYELLEFPSDYDLFAGDDRRFWVQLGSVYAAFLVTGYEAYEELTAWNAAAYDGVHGTADYSPTTGALQLTLADVPASPASPLAWEYNIYVKTGNDVKRLKSGLDGGDWHFEWSRGDLSHAGVDGIGPGDQIWACIEPSSGGDASRLGYYNILLGTFTELPGGG